MKEIIAKLVSTNDTQRYYELSSPISKGRNFGRDVDIVAELEECREKRMKPEHKNFLRTDGCHIICISDAYTHTERLAFVGEKFPSGYGRTGIQIDGSHTMKLYGGDKRYVYPDEVYLRHLGMINGVKIVLDKSQTNKETNKVKVNDKVVCVSNSGRETELTVGKVYKVIATNYDDFATDGTFLICVKNDEGDMIDYGGIKFKTNINRTGDSPELLLD